MPTNKIINPNETEKEPLSEEIKINKMNEKCCVDCKTTKTPLWRSGPAGPKSLCNACGIRQRKKRVTKYLVDSSKVENDKKKRKYFKEENSSMRNEKKRGCVRNGKEGKLCADLRRSVMALGKKVVFLQRQSSPMRRQRQRRSSSISTSGSGSGSRYQKLGEVEQAAVLLMAMSCGSVFA